MKDLLLPIYIEQHTKTQMHNTRLAIHPFFGWEAGVGENNRMHIFGNEKCFGFSPSALSQKLVSTINIFSLSLLYSSLLLSA